MAPLLIPAEWVEDKLNHYKKLKDSIRKEIISIGLNITNDTDLGKEEFDRVIILHNLFARYKDCEDLLKEMKEASITKP